MDLLPKNHKQFQDENYWRNFFSGKKTREGFEWYASYEELEYYLKQTIKKPESSILVVGCGNSLLSEKVYQEMKIEKIISIDFEENVINKMKQRSVPIDYRVIDMLNMKEIETGSQDFVLDKGSLDALCADKSKETRDKVIQYFKEIQRVLNPKGGAYVCVSLLQDFILEALTDYFNKGQNNEQFEDFIIDFRIQKIEKVSHTSDDGSAYVPFFVTIKQTQIGRDDAKVQELRKKLSQIINFQDSPQNKAEMLPFEQASDRVKREQMTALYAPKMKDLRLGQKYELLCYDRNVSTVNPRYILIVIDSSDKKILKKRSCAAFITPQGKERETMFATEVGRQSLAAQAGFSRLIIIILNHGHKFESIETVKAEMSAKVVELAPTKCSNNKQIPFLTVGKDIGERVEVFKSPDGQILIEDFKDQDQDVFRQVIFMNKPEMIQSEVMFSYKNSKKHQIPDDQKAHSELCPKKKQRTLVYNHEFLCSEYQYSMLAGLSLSANLHEKQKLKILVLGTGAGLLPMFLKNQLGDNIEQIVTVEINEQMIKVAKEYFGFKEDEKLNSVIQDAYQYVNESENQMFDIIFMDINYEEEYLGISPPMKFLEPNFLQKLMSMISKDGFLTFNLLCYDKGTLDKVFSKIGEVTAESKLYIQGEEDLNKVVFLTQGKTIEEGQRLSQMENLIKKWNVNKGNWLTDMRIKEQIEKFKNINE